MKSVCVFCGSASGANPVYAVSARELGREPYELRRQNIVTAQEMPYQTAAGMRLDTGDYVDAFAASVTSVGSSRTRRSTK